MAIGDTVYIFVPPVVAADWLMVSPHVVLIGKTISVGFDPSGRY